MTHKKPDESTQSQLLELGYNHSTNALSHARPLLICDVDEVVLHLVNPFIKVLEQRGYVLQSRSFKLTGNIFDAKTGREATQQEVWDGLTQLFEEQASRQGIVDGVVDHLNALSAEIDIVFLSNMPHAFGDIRREYLAEHGLKFPLITNSGSKVPAIQNIQAHCQNQVGFIDDTPKNLQQVRDGTQDIHLFHFMANEEFRDLAGDIEGAHISSGDWRETAQKIQSVFVENT